MKPSRSTQSQAAPTKKTSKMTATPAAPKPKKNKVIRISSEEVALRAYFIGERRRSLGTAGDETSDWVQAEHELNQELEDK